jgi:Ca2+-binding RTX toxin-like protein
MSVAATINLANGDQTSGDSTVVSNFQNVDASALSTALSITGSSAANALTGGSGNDAIDGGGGADVISAGAGNDSVTYRGTETSIDGGTGTNTLVLAAVATVNLGSVDQTSLDSTTVSNFQNVDASALSSAVTLTGSSSVNTITGGSGADTIDGGGGADIIAAGAGNDTVTYRGSESSIDGGTGADTLVLAAAGGITAVNFSVAAGSDQTTGDSVGITNFESIDASILSTAVTVTGSSSANTITTGSGNDIIDGGGGIDVISAGSGNDTVSYYGAESSIDGGSGTNTLLLKAAVTVNLGNTDVTSGDAPNVTNFQNVDASALSSAVSLTGSSSVNTITGGSGADTIDGAGGADIIAAGAGNDSVTYRGTEVSIDGGAGTDTLVLAVAGGIAAVNFSVAAGVDQTSGDSVGITNFESIDASILSTAVTVTGSSSVNTITTGSGADTIDGGGGADVISAGGGNDTVTYRGTESSIDGGTGSNTLLMSAAATVNLANGDQTTSDSTAVSNFQNVDASALSSAVSLTGSSSANAITGGSGADTIDGGGGADVIAAGAGNDSVAYRGTESSIDGGTGTNTLILDVTATVNLGSTDETSGDSVNVTNFLNVDASALSSAVSLMGSSLANTITGGSGDDTIDGGGGADVIHAGAGDDTVTYHGTETWIDGGVGSDSLVLASSGGITAVDFSVAAGADQTSGDGVSVTNFENLDASSMSSAMSVTGSSSANTITTGSGNDTIDGGGGADVIHAGAGNDTVIYHGTETSIDGGAGINTFVMASTATVNLGSADETPSDTTNVTNFQNVDASGLSSGVFITGSSSANTMTGGSGDDTIDGAGGADIINAGGGDDTVVYHGTETSINGGSGTNTLVLDAATTVNLGNADQTFGDSTNVSNFQNVDGSALSSALTITGSSSNNTLIGGSGNDIISGGGGTDHLFGGDGDDIFIVDGTSLALGTTIDGGTGNNTVDIAANSGTITDTELAASLTNVETIDFTANNVTASLNLSGSQISQMDGGAANTLTLLTNAGDTLNITDAVANYSQSTVGNTTNYTIYDDAAHSNVVAHLSLVA